ncbi:MAG: GAF domain-containing protein [Candidatus Eisenbacteria bacterium]|uniref:GAF domain-containing protein n=1 Tax=Eiseniibacteriota bacterium TaxID=2212470 RepID=A0A933SG90_UNCEI|nr:GAF domain-containing protein [Candidatus Eisenbacteria bacterium]
MSRFPIREIADRLAAAHDSAAVLDALLAYLRALQGDWHPTVAIFDPSREVFERVYARERGRLEAREVSLPLDHLPARLVRKFVRPSAFFNGGDRRSLLEKLFQNSPGYEPDRFEAPQIQPLTAPVAWRSCLCLPLNDRDELLGMVVIATTRVGAFTPAVVGELQPVRSLASLALARRLHAEGRVTVEARTADDNHRRMIHGLQSQLQQAQDEALRAAEQHAAAIATIETLRRELEVRQSEGPVRTAREAADADQLLKRLGALEEQNASATAHLSEAFAQLAASQSRQAELQRTLDLVREGFAVIAGDPAAESLTRSFVGWFCEQFQVERCSLMRMDARQNDLRILAHRGMDPAVAPGVRVPVGEGVAGWVAHHRKSVLVRDRSHASPVTGSGKQDYHSDSYMSLPLQHRGRLVGVLNLSNRRDGEAFDELDLERAELAANVLAMALGGGLEAAEAA